MVRVRRLAAGLVLAGALLTAGPASAGPLWDWLCGPCPRPSYSPARYLAPQLARVHDCIHGPKVNVQPPDRHPEIPPDWVILGFPCPAAYPTETFIPRPTPPATSRFQYLQGGTATTGGTIAPSVP